MLRTRIAPTPSGFLHLGNALSFITTWLWARSTKGQLALRIDDLDGPRTQDAFVDDIFEQLDWMGIDWDQGPRSRKELEERYSQSLRLPRYREAFSCLWSASDRRLFSCGCSRSELASQGAGGVYPGLCRTKNLPHAPGERAIRLKSTPGQPLGDFVVWRREDLPAYQLASVIDDLDLEINFVVRGADLHASTEAQKDLAQALAAAGWPKADTFRSIRFVHHPLITGPDGEKLSKSAHSLSLGEMRKAGFTPTDLVKQTADFLKLSPRVATLQDLLNAFGESRHD